MKKTVKATDIPETGIVNWMILVKGTVLYDDVFGDSHETVFKRYMIVWELKKADASASAYEISDHIEWSKTEAPEDNRAT